MNCKNCEASTVDYVPYGDTWVAMSVGCDCGDTADMYEVYVGEVVLPVTDSDPEAAPIYLFVSEVDDSTDFIPEADWSNEPAVMELVDSLKFFFPKIEGRSTFGVIEAALSKISGNPVQLADIAYDKALRAIN
jgi:hypothetical protein